ncbi:MAG: ankyrin repeat domain-containing protein, partial [Thiolinea sp.]
MTFAAHPPDFWRQPEDAEQQGRLLASADSAYRVEWLLQHGVNLNALDQDGNTALHNLLGAYSLSADQAAFVARLLRARPKLDIRNAEGKTPLYLALEQQHQEQAMALLAAGADPNLADKEGVTPLVFAVRHNDKALLQALLDKGAAVNLQDKSGQNPLFALVDSGTATDLIDLLIAAGVDLKITDKQGQGILQALAESRSKDEALPRLRKLLEQGLSPKVSNARRETPLHLAVISNAPKTAALLLDYQADPNAQDAEGATPLHYAVRIHSFRLLDALLKHHADPGKLNYYGKSPLHLAVEQGNQGMVEALLAAQASVNTQDRDLRTPLISAVANNHTEIALLLLEHDALVHVASKGGWQALHFAVSQGNTALIRALLARGADPGAKLWNGSSAMDLLAKLDEKVRTPLQPLLTQGNTAPVSHDSAAPPLHQALGARDVSRVKQLLQQGADPATLDRFGRSALEKALIVAYQDTDRAQAMLK